MSKKELEEVFNLLPGTAQGIHWHTLDKLANGKVSINKKNIITVPISMPLEELGSEVNDLRAALAPFCFDNDMVPMIVFIEPKKYLEALKVGKLDDSPMLAKANG